MAVSLRAHSVVASARGRQANRNVRTKACLRKPIDGKEVAYREEADREEDCMEVAPNATRLRIIAKAESKVPAALYCSSGTVARLAGFLGLDY